MDYKILQNSNPDMIEMHRVVRGYGMGQERVMTVLFFSKSVGYFCVQQITSNAGDVFRYKILPQSEEKPHIEDHLGDGGYSKWVVNEWFAPWIKDDMLS